MITLQLPNEVGRRLEALAASSRLSASVHAERAIAGHLGGPADVARLHRRPPEPGDRVWLDGGGWCLTSG